jgi:hypothetical protein
MVFTTHRERVIPDNPRMKEYTVAHKVTKFTDPAGTYVTAYTSNTITPNTQESSNSVTGVIHIEITSGTLSVLARLSPDANFVVIKTYTLSTIEQIVLASQMRIVTTGEAKAWLSELA